jgi:arylsulfatase A-like enzyme
MMCLFRLRWLFAVVALGLAAAPLQAQGKTNVIVILADDLGWGDLGCYGHPKFKTPNLDRLAKSGARLTNFYTPVPFCAPTRASLLTGRYPPRHGLTSNPFPKEDPAGPKNDDLGLPLSEVTLANLLRAAGYRTGCIGKWHLGHHKQFRPLERGFDEYLGILYSNDMHRVELFKDDKMVEYPVVQATLTQRYTEAAIDFLIRNRDRPFFLYLAHAMPHKPLACSERFYGKSGAGLYGDVMAELDWSVGQVLAKLKELGLDENTLVIFTSDNGPWFGGSSGGLRGMKGMHWEGGLRVPCIAAWPGNIPAGRDIPAPAGIIDLLPTALAATKVAAPKDRVLDGKDLLPLLTGKTDKSPHEALFSFRGDKISTVRSGKWKLHLMPPASGKSKVLKPGAPYLDPRRPDGVRILAPYEQAHPSEFPGVQTGHVVTKIGLFDLDADPAEQRNVAEREAEVVRRLRGLAERFHSALSSDGGRGTPTRR